MLADVPDITAATDKRKCKVEHNNEHVIETKGAPVFAKARQLYAGKAKIVKDAFKSMLTEGLCRPSKSSWASPIHIVPRKACGELRVVGDYCQLNAITTPDRYPILNILDFNINLNGAKIFTKIDIFRAYYQIPVAESDIHKTAMITPFGLFEFPVMLFSLWNSRQTFQRFMDWLMCDPDFVYCYLSNILIALESKEMHTTHVRLVLERLYNAGLMINASMCEYTKTKMPFLGYVIDSKGIWPASDRVQPMLDYGKLVTIKELHRFLGLINLY